MALKRIFGINSKKGRACLHCGRILDAAQLKNDAIATCAECGQQHFVDLRAGGMCVLTVFERPDLRRKETKADPVPELQQEQAKEKHERKRRRDEKKPERAEVEELKQQLKEALKRAEMAEQDAKEWERAAEGLARMVEIYTEERRQLRAILKVGAGNNPAKT